MFDAYDLVAMSLTCLGLGVLAGISIGRRIERRSVAKAQALVAPMLKLGIEAFNRADSNTLSKRGARRTEHRFDVKGRG
jgi:hypothetical protein